MGKKLKTVICILKTPFSHHNLGTYKFSTILLLYRNLDYLPKLYLTSVRGQMETPYWDSRMTMMMATLWDSLSEVTNHLLVVFPRNNMEAQVVPISLSQRNLMKDPQSSQSFPQPKTTSQILFKNFTLPSKMMSTKNMPRLDSFPIKKREWLN